MRGLAAILRGRRGMAVIMAVLAVAFVAAATLRLNLTVRASVESAATLVDGVEVDAMLRSGLAVARAVLLADQLDNRFDGPADPWADGTLKEVSGLLGLPGSLSVAVEDLTGGLPVTGLVPALRRARNPREKREFEKQARALRQVWLNLLTSGRYAVRDDNEAEALLDTLVDWLDKNDDEHEHGAEKGYYLGLRPPYACRNGPLRQREELLLIKGWSRALLYGDKEHPGIISLVDVHGEARININTAPAPVLKALGNLDDDMVADLIEFREDEENKERLASVNWYKSVLPGDIKFPRELVSVAGTHFRITVRARYNGLERSGEGVLHRNPNREQTLLSWQVR